MSVQHPSCKILKVFQEVPCEKGVCTLLQRKGVTEMEPVLALPLVSSACLAFLRRHLPLSAQQQRLIDDSLAANAGRLESLTAALRSAAATKVCSCTSHCSTDACCAVAPALCCAALPMLHPWRRAACHAPLQPSCMAGHRIVRKLVCHLTSFEEASEHYNPLACGAQDGFSGDAVTLEAHAETAAPAEATPSSNEAGSLAAAGLVALEERVEADTVGSPVRCMAPTRLVCTPSLAPTVCLY